MLATPSSPSPDRERGPGGEGVRALGALLLLASITACAKIAPPPGGPPDAVAPALIATRPDTLGVYPDFEGSVEFIFDETVSEGGTANQGYGSGDLERLIVLSPTDRVPRVRWERSRITVRPRDGWRPNTVYRIELLPGVTDLRRNRAQGGRVITFTTGAPLPTDSLSGYLIDWTTRQPARLAAVEAVLLPDSLAYRTQSDSAGRFVLAPLPHGTYLLRGFLDLNRNRQLDGRETWDTLTVTPSPGGSGVLWFAQRDTIPLRIATTTVRDSLTLDIQLTQSIDPYQSLDTTNVRLFLLPDSTPVAVSSFRPRPVDDSLVTRAKAVADSGRAPPVVPPPAAPPRGQLVRAQEPIDSTAIKLAQTRPPLGDRLVLRLVVPMTAEAKYTFQALGLRTLGGVVGNPVSGFGAPKPPPPRASTDTTRSDSTAPLPRRP